MTSRRVVLTAAVAFVVAASGASCEPPDTGGGGGGGGTSSFTQGFVFIRADDRNIYVSDKSSSYTEVSRLTTTGNNKHPSLSPNGKQVVFVNQQADASALQTASLADGTVQTVLTSDATKARFANPVFSPDGTRIAFTFERSGASILAIVNVDGSGLQELSTSALQYISPSFYPDGAHVLVAAGNASTGFTQLEKVNVDTGTPENILNGLGNEALGVRERVVISKDGTRAAFQSQVSSGVMRIFVADLAGGTVTQLSDPGEATANDSFPTWIGSGEIAFSSDVGGNDQVYVLPATAVKQSGALRLPSAVEPWFGPN